jgi:hypothetical protein
MRTRSELEIVARHLEQRMRERQAELGSRPEVPPAGSAARSEALFTFPESTVTLNTRADPEGPQIHRMVRHIAAVQVGTGPEFRLVEEEFVSNPAGELERHYEPLDITTDGGALGIVSAGFQRLDEDRLWERIGPVVARIEANGFTGGEQAEAVAELDRSVSELDLSATARMRMRIDMIDLLEGRLEMGDFVARTVARQECFAVTQRVALSEQCRESIEV